MELLNAHSHNLYSDAPFHHSIRNDDGICAYIKRDCVFKCIIGWDNPSLLLRMREILIKATDNKRWIFEHFKKLRAAGRTVGTSPIRGASIEIRQIKSSHFVQCECLVAF